MALGMMGLGVFAFSSEWMRIEEANDLVAPLKSLTPNLEALLLFAIELVRVEGADIVHSTRKSVRKDSHPY